MLKFENAAKPGDRIRAHDFYQRHDCYVEGVVQRVSDERGFLAFVITVDKDGWPDHDDTVVREGDSRVGCTTYVPLEVAFLEWDGRVLNLTRDMDRVNRQREIQEDMNPKAGKTTLEYLREAREGGMYGYGSDDD